MGQFKTLERLHHQLHCYGRLGFWSDGDEVFDNVCRYGPTHRKDYIYQCISDFEKELTWLPDSIKETRLEAILSTLATFWNEAREYNMDTGEGYDCEQSFITTVRAYFELALKYIAVSYYNYLLTEKEECIDIYSIMHGLDSRQIAQVLSTLNICRESKFSQLERENIDRNSVDDNPAAIQETPSQKAQKTIKDEIDNSLESVLEPICSKLIKEKMVIRSSDKLTWIFKGTEEQYAYLGFKFKEACSLSKIPWQSISESISFKGKISTAKKYASEFAQGKRNYPSGYVKINSAFDRLQK